MRGIAFQRSSERWGTDRSIARNQNEIVLLLALQDFRQKLDLIESVVNIILKRLREE